MDETRPGPNPPALSAGDAISRRTFGQALGLAAAAGSFPMLPDDGRGEPAGTGAPPADDGLCDVSAIELADRIRRKQVSARDVMTAHLARIERVNPKVNAIVTLVAERAMADAAKADEQTARG